MNQGFLLVILFVKLLPFYSELRNIHPFLSVARIKERPFKTVFNPLKYLVKNIYKFYNGPSFQYQIKCENIINNYRLIKQRGYFNSDIINIRSYGGHGLYKGLYPVPRVPKSNY